MPQPLFRPLVEHLTLRARVFWIAILPPLLMPLIFLWLKVGIPTSRGSIESLSFQYAGVALQMLGLWLVAKAIRDTLRTFKRPSLLQQTWDWFAILLVYLGVISPPKRDSLLIPSTGHIRVEGGRPSLIRSRARTVEERLIVLESTLDEVRNEIATHRESTDQAIQTIRRQLVREATARQDLKYQITTLMERQAVEEIHWEIVGLVWLFFGTLYAGIPDELAGVLSHVHI